MKEINIASPAHLEAELTEIADAVGVPFERLVAYFFAREVVHT